MYLYSRTKQPRCNTFCTKIRTVFSTIRTDHCILIHALTCLALLLWHICSEKSVPLGHDAASDLIPSKWRKYVFRNFANSLPPWRTVISRKNKFPEGNVVGILKLTRKLCSYCAILYCVKRKQKSPRRFNSSVANTKFSSWLSSYRTAKLAVADQLRDCRVSLLRYALVVQNFDYRCYAIHCFFLFATSTAVKQLGLVKTKVVLYSLYNGVITLARGISLVSYASLQKPHWEYFVKRELLKL